MLFPFRIYIILGFRFVAALQRHLDVFVTGENLGKDKVRLHLNVDIAWKTYGQLIPVGVGIVINQRDIAAFFLLFKADVIGVTGGYDLISGLLSECHSQHTAVDLRLHYISFRLFVIFDLHPFQGDDGEFFHGKCKNVSRGFFDVIRRGNTIDKIIIQESHSPDPLPVGTGKGMFLSGLQIHHPDTGVFGEIFLVFYGDDSLVFGGSDALIDHA